MKPHIYRHAGRWYCRRDYEHVRHIGIAADSPEEAYRRAADYHKWMLT